MNGVRFSFGSGKEGARRAGCAGPLAASRASGPAGFGWAVLGWEEREWLLGWARLPAGFRSTTRIVFKIPFLFPNLFMICKLI
jgi:hypothetical protein